MSALFLTTLSFSFSISEFIFLQNDMEILTDIVEGTKIGKKFSQISATQMSRRIYDTIGNIYYIGAIKATAVNYVGEKNKLCGTFILPKSLLTYTSASPR